MQLRNFVLFEQGNEYKNTRIESRLKTPPLSDKCYRCYTIKKGFYNLTSPLYEPKADMPVN
ncbi:hypothetical protein DMTZ50_0154 [Dehalococcoides mccartyi]|uniref:Uncharacterized protein n=1 Tax=Dehalococcoides mccartyi TaxID=61435 RepID=A0A142VC35_9CHLR|nr:hypothetical protein Dm11a5_1542 [Dehalococcoides mccartyi]MBA2084353.1 hypothetical protein [Dehalococcoides mccartyi]